MRTLAVSEIDQLCEGVRRLVLRDPGGRPLPTFSPGSSIAIGVYGGARNSYSLTGPSRRPDHYAISVRRDDEGRGGSRWLHTVAVGDELEVSEPSSAFPPVLAARHHLLIAGGIGVTPVLSHVRAAVEWGRSFEVLYSFRPGGGAHLADLIALAGDRLSAATDRVAMRRLLEDALLRQPWGTHLYVCGPLAMIDDVRAAALGAGWPEARIHAEAFRGADLDPGVPFEARLIKTGKRVRVDAGVSLLEALLDADVAVPNLCRQGVCGECRLPARPTRINHRDTYLTDEEKGRGDCLMACVSRPVSTTLELEL